MAKLDEFTDHMRYQWWIHGHINFVLLSSSAFCDLYDKLMEPEETTESYQTLQGFHTRSVDAQRGLWDLSRMAKASPALRELFLTKTPAEVLEALDDDRRGQGLPQQARRLPLRVRLAQRRGLRPGRHPVAGGSVDPARPASAR